MTMAAVIHTRQPLLTQLCACSPAFARIVDRALRKDLPDRYQSAQEMLNDVEIEMVRFDDDMKAALEAQEEMKKHLLAKHQQVLGLLQHRMQIESEGLNTKMMTMRVHKMKEHDKINNTKEHTMSQKALSEDAKLTYILFQKSQLRKEAELERNLFKENLSAEFQVQKVVKNKMLAMHEEERVRLEEKIRIDIAEWVVLEKQMRDDVREFEEKIKMERERRMINLAHEEKKMLQASQKIEKLSEMDRMAMIDNQQARLKQMSKDEQIRKEREEETLRRKVEERTQKKGRDFKTDFPDIQGDEHRADAGAASEHHNLPRTLALNAGWIDGAYCKPFQTEQKSGDFQEYKPPPSPERLISSNVLQEELNLFLNASVERAGLQITEDSQDLCLFHLKEEPVFVKATTQVEVIHKIIEAHRICPVETEVSPFTTVSKEQERSQKNEKFARLLELEISLAAALEDEVAAATKERESIVLSSQNSDAIVGQPHCNIVDLASNQAEEKKSQKALLD